MKAGHEAVRAAARARHPSLPPWLFRWSEGNQLWFLAFRCAQSGEWLDALHLGALTIVRDGGFVLRPVLWRAIVRYVPRLFARRKVRAGSPDSARRFLDGGPPPKLQHTAQLTSDELQRAKRIATVKVRQRECAFSGAQVACEIEPLIDTTSRAV
jgi:hypothetical protein